jgi:hypothetical protein
MRRIRLSAVALAALGLLAGSAQAKPWGVHTVVTAGPAFSRGVDMLPNGRAAILMQRAAGGSNRLELRIGGRTRLLDTSAHVFFATGIGHDAHGRLVVVWRRVLDGTIQVFAWTARGGREQVSNARKSVSHVSLSVARSGRAALAYQSPEGVFVARGATAHGFEAPTAVAPAGTSAAQPGVAVSSTGRLVVAWSDGKRIVVRAASGPGPFSSPQPVALRAPTAGSTLVPGAPDVVITSTGRAVVVVSSFELRGSAPVPGQKPVIVDQRVEAFDWTRKAAHPSAAATLSRGAAAGTADVVAQGASALIAWTQQPPGGPRALWVARWTPPGLQRPNLYDTHNLGLPVLLVPAPRGGVDAYYEAGGARWFTVRLSAAGLFTGTSSVTPPSQQIPLIDVAAEGARAIAGWTIGRRNARVQVARPAS